MKYLLPIFSFFLSGLFVSSCSLSNPETESECKSKKKLSTTMNASELFDATSVCWLEEEKDLSAYFQNLGQIRAITDMTLYSPQKEDEEKVTELYTRLYYQFGGPGDDEMFRSDDRYATLISQIETATLSNENGYSPGWKYKPSSKTTLYNEFRDDAKNMRLWQLESYKRLLSNNAYYEAHKAANLLQLENPTLTVGTEAYDEYQKLNEIMREVSSSIEKLPPPQNSAPYHLLVEIDQDANFTQLDTKYNGPDKGQIELFQNKEDVLNSWVPKSYEMAELEEILNRIDFENVVLMVLSIGGMTNHSGKVVLNTFEKKKDWDSYTVGVSVGVISPECELPSSESFPFILATAPRIKDMQVTSRSRSNFPDECGPVVSGVSVPRK